jgi:hypothetical protein
MVTLPFETGKSLSFRNMTGSDANNVGFKGGKTRGRRFDVTLAVATIARPAWARAIEAAFDLRDVEVQ